MTDSDRERFAQLMTQIGEVLPVKNIPSPDKIDFFFECLRDLDFEQVKENAILFMQTDGKFFPSVAQLRGQGDDKEIAALQAWDRINFYLDAFYAPEIGHCMMDVIKRRMEKNGEGHLYRFLVKWGPEILSTTSITATRKHFLDAYKAQAVIDERRQLTEKQTKSELATMAGKILTGSDKE